MDRQLARMFDLDRPLMERIHERNLKTDFVKAASAMEIDLTKLSSEEVAELYNVHVGLDLQQQQMQAKTAEAIKIGRLLARRMMEKVAQAPIPMPQAATVAALPYNMGIFEAAHNGYLGLEQELQAALRSGNPQQLQAVQSEVMQHWQTFAKGGVDEARYGRLLARAGIGGNTATQLLQDFKDHQNEMRKFLGGLHPTVAARQARLLTHGARGPQAALQALRTGQYQMIAGPGGAAAAGGAASGWGPSGLLRALESGDWMTAGKKMLPIAAVGLGVSHLMKRRQEQERERQLAMMQSPIGPTPSAGLRSPMGLPAPGGRP